MQRTKNEDDETPHVINWPATLGVGIAALAVFGAAVAAHLQRACTVMDTPYLPLCAEASSEPAAVEEKLRERLALNPGDAWAWTKLLVANGEPSDSVAVAAETVAPNHPSVQRWRAARALESGEHAKGVDLLVQMVSSRNSAEAARLLARIAISPEGVALLRPHLARAELWLPKILVQLGVMKVPAGTALSLVAAALDAGTLPDQVRRSYMRSLKATGQWLEAYGLWLAYHKEPVPLLYNAGFDKPLEADGFDWEFTPVVRSRAGFTASQSALARRGLILELEFTGRGFAPPVLRQHVFAPAGMYRLAGEYASKVRSESGLMWNIACNLGNNEVAGSSSPLVDTGGVWRRFQVDFTIPAQCGPVATIQLMPTAAHEAASGLRGQFSLDALSLAPTTK